MVAFEFIQKVAREEDQIVAVTCLIRDQKNREQQIKQKYNEFTKKHSEVRKY